MDANRSHRNVFRSPSRRRDSSDTLDPRLSAIVNATPVLTRAEEIDLTTRIVAAVGTCWSACLGAFVRESQRADLLAVAADALRGAPAEETAPPPADTATSFALTPMVCLVAKERAALAGIRARDLDWRALRAAQAHTLGALDETAANPRASLPTRTRATEARRAVISAATTLDRLVSRMTAANLRLVILIASKERPGLPFADLVQEGSTGLIKAIRRFDPTRGWRFATLAAHWIRADLGRANDNTGESIRRPVHVIDAAPKAKRAVVALTAKLGRAPTTEEVAKAIGKTAEVTSAALHPAGVFSLHAPVPQRTLDAGPRSPALFIPDDAPSALDLAEQADIADAVRDTLAMLRPTESEVLRHRFGIGTGEDGVSFALAGGAIGVSRERARQIVIGAMARVRRIAHTRENLTDAARAMAYLATYEL